MQENLIYRSYRSADCQQVWDLHVRALGSAFIGHGPWDEDLKQIESVYLTHGAFWICTPADNQNLVVGMGALRPIKDNEQAVDLVGEIKRMRVDPAYRRQGIAQTILTKLLEDAKRLGFQSLELDVSCELQPALALYQKAGFQTFKRGKMDGLATIWMRMNLAKDQRHF
jgi:ribosomal protein S18 acetylase RimI-like enzyme